MTKSRGILRTRRYWSDEDLAVVRAEYADAPTAELAKRVGRPLSAVYQAAAKLGLKKSDAYHASGVSGRLHAEIARTNPRIVATQFKKGQVPPNKGLRRPGWGPGRMKETMFKKGAMPHTWQPVGTEILRRDGYVWVKVRDDATPARHDWTQKQRHIYAQANGPIPPDHIVIFRDKNRKNFALDNLECISRRELAQRNVHSYPLELRQVTQLRGAISRQINKRRPPVKKPIGRPRKERIAA